MSRSITLALLLIIYTTFAAQAQKPGATLAQQYQDVVVKSGSYKGFKEIRENKIELLWRNTMDSLQRGKQLLKEVQAKLAASGQTVSNSENELAAVQSELKEARARVNEVSLLGLYMEKGSYNLIMWGLVAALAAALTFAVMRTKASLKEARYRSSLYNELFEELRDYKAKANEKEKKLARELQTERNRLAEMTGRY